MMDENPSAFPMTGEGFGDDHYRTWQRGMTLRDWFAGQALAATIALSLDVVHTAPSPMPMAARLAYEAADAMLAARGPQ